MIFVHKRSGALFSSSYSAHIICYFILKTTSFSFFTPGFSCFCMETTRVTTAIMLNMDDPLAEEDVVMSFD